MARKKVYNKYHHEGGFIGLPRRVFLSDAYASLHPVARCILDEFQCFYRADRNGRLVLSQKQAMDRLGIKHDRTIVKYFEQLQDRGFIERTYDGDYRRGKAREYRLTYQPCYGREPTDEWKEWKPEN